VTTARTARVLLVAMTVAYLAIASAMWVIAFSIADQQPRAAMIGAASAFTAAGAGVIGGLYSAGRGNALQRERELDAIKREAFVQTIIAIDELSSALEDKKVYKAAMEDNAHPEVQQSAKDKWVPCLQDVEKRRDVLLRAVLRVRLICKHHLRNDLEAFADNLRGTTAAELAIDDSTTTSIEDRMRAELGVTS